MVHWFHWFALPYQLRWPYFYFRHYNSDAAAVLSQTASIEFGQNQGNGGGGSARYSRLPACVLYDRGLSITTQIAIAQFLHVVYALIAICSSDLCFGTSKRIGLAAQLFKSGACRISFCKISSLIHSTTGKGNCLRNSSRIKFVALNTRSSATTDSKPKTINAGGSGVSSDASMLVNNVLTDGDRVNV